MRIKATAGAFKTRANKGIFQLAINGLNVGQPQGEYYPSLTYVVRDIETVSFSVAGNYAFKFTVTGKNASSTGPVSTVVPSMTMILLCAIACIESTYGSTPSCARKSAAE